MLKITVTPEEVEHIAKLAQIPISDEEKQEFAKAFAETLTVVDELRELDTSHTSPTHQVTGLENVWREDKIDRKKMFTQEEALANGAKIHQGFFVVPRVLEEKDV
ncbi:MAG TPA: Asp-tRNA(Asn)/Glu-tRNA(Gln) amidotransferase subunit GatC [Patescibacteria group bacterium]|jgi:aspartyl-tRNA(Asn)/glutamyl-tRNA(Gln) amidotransferase subunit C